MSTESRLLDITSLLGYPAGCNNKNSVWRHNITNTSTEWPQKSQGCQKEVMKTLTGCHKNVSKTSQGNHKEGTTDFHYIK